MRLIIALAIALTLSGAAYAETRLTVPVEGSKCYSLEEAEAEQGIRIHSELMVIGLNCQHMARSAGNKNLYSKYQEFTREHVRLFAEYETKLMRYYQRTGDGNPESSLNKLRTVFANKISNDAARMRPDLFCSRYAPRLDKVSTMGNSDIRKWAATFYPSHPVSKPICGEARQ